MPPQCPTIYPYSWSTRYWSKTKQKIVGYKFDEHEHKILQYADDTCICITKTESIKELLEILQIYEKASGAKVNISKTDGMEQQN